MRRVLWLVVAAIVAGGLAAGGCARDQGKPNPGLKVPDIPPGDRGGKAPVNRTAPAPAEK